MKKKKFSIAKHVVASLFVTSILLLFFLVTVTYKQMRVQNESGELLSHTKDVETKLVQLTLCLKDAETVQRGYLLTQDTILLQPNKASFEETKAIVNTLQDLLANDKEQTQNLDTLSDLVHQRLITLEKVMEENKASDGKLSVVHHIMNGKRLMDEIQVHSDKMIAIERKVQQDMEAQYSQDLRLSPLFFFGTSLFALLVFVGAFSMLYRNVISVQRVNVQLRHSQATIEEKIVELEHLNSELDSFNHVASHDLQEPLRKVQTFISRIAENDFPILPEKTKEYFLRIQVAANRMQSLIEDLLAYTLSDKADSVFELTDMNGILESSKQEFAETIEEKNAIIRSSALPTVRVIPFQMQQLLSNLIGNSLKFSRPNSATIITVHSETISGDKLPDIDADPEKEYHKITITDNGIGFDQENADKIFDLFHRLHEDDEYSGTGIGLTICKKIVENHKGFISAEGNENNGAVFTVLIPA